MKAISIRQPWAWAIINAGKRIENRDWRGSWSYRGPILIHAAKGCTKDEYDRARAWMRDQQLAGVAHPVGRDSTVLPVIPPLEALERGGFVGRAQLVGVIRPGEDHPSPWYMGSLGLVLADVEALPFTPYRGELGLFDVPDIYNLRGQPR